MRKGGVGTMSEGAITNIYNYLPISSTLATAGQPTKEQFAAIKEAGYEVVINLAADDPPYAVVDEAEIVHQQGMEYIHIPVDWKAPTTADLDAFIAAMERNQERKRFVHCIANMRVSAFLFLYRVIEEQIAADEAQELLHRIWQPNPVWATFIEDELARRNIAW
jgi:protein tyrosine phosphatase (PTP) superfamily phosphohydrolase (DUF442 family)